MFHSEEVEIKLLHPLAQVPVQGTLFSAGYDLIAAIDEQIVIRHGEPAVLIPTGIAIHIKNPNMAALLLPRSGLGHKEGLVLGNTLGLIDADYQGQWFVSATNRGNKKNEDGSFCDIVIHPGDRITQMIMIPVLHPTFKVVSDFSAEEERGAGGFGSTGKHVSSAVAHEALAATASYPSGSIGKAV